MFTMKKTLIALAGLVLLAACGGKSSSDKSATNTSTADLSKNPDYQKGLELVSKNRCMTCHTISEPLTGPPYKEVAKKYANSPDTIVTHLANKVIHGGGGVWGELAMSPNSDVSQADAEAMVKYILLLK